MSSASTMKPQQTYTPTSAELKDAVSSLIEGPPEKLSLELSKSIQKALHENNPTWKLPPRRAMRYIKKELKKKNKTGTATSTTTSLYDDDDASSVTSNTSTASSVARLVMNKTSSSLRNVLKKKDGSSSSRFSFRRNNKGSKTTPPPSKITLPPQQPKLLPSLSYEQEHSVDDVIQMKLSKEAMSADALIVTADEKQDATIAVPEPAVTPDSVVSDDVYQDDNDGTSDNHCAECIKCVIL